MTSCSSVVMELSCSSTIIEWIFPLGILVVHTDGNASVRVHFVW